MIVTGTAVPLGPNTWVIPTFLPNNAFSISFIPLSSFSISARTMRALRGSEWYRGLSTQTHRDLYCRESLQFDFDIHACGQVQTCQGFNGLVRRIDDVNQTLVRANLKLFARVFVDERRTYDCVLVNLRWQRHRP